MLEVLVGYIKDAGINIRWHACMAGDARFFSITKRIHNRLHGSSGDGGELGTSKAGHSAAVTAANASSARDLVQKGDVVLLHDPRAAGMAAALAETRRPRRLALPRRARWIKPVDRRTWSFLRPHLSGCEAYIFSRPRIRPSMDGYVRVRIIPPSIDPFSPKRPRDVPRGRHPNSSDDRLTAATRAVDSWHLRP